MGKIILELSESIHRNLVEHIMENYDRYFYLAYSFTKNKEVAMDVVTNAIYFSLYNGRKLKTLPPMQTWILQLIVKDGMRTMRKTNYKRDFTANSQLYAYMETLEPSATNAFKLYYFENLNLEKICGVLHFNEYEAKRRLSYVRGELHIDSSLDEESKEKIDELVRIYESVEIPENFPDKVKDAIKREEDNFDDFYKKYSRNKILKPIGLIALALVFFFITIMLGKDNPDFAAAVLNVPIINKIFMPFL